ncbi:MAG: glutamine synthetase, partial [Pseudomonadota bacterium]
MSDYATGQEWRDFHAAHPGLEYLDVMSIDLSGNAFGKRVPVGQVAGLLDKGTAICAAMQLTDVLNNTADPMGHGFSDGDPDGLARPLAGTFAPVPWSGGKGAQVLCELCDPASGAPYWYEPRAVLAQVVRRFADLGLRPVLALELEFYLIERARGERGAPVPVRSPSDGRPEGEGRVLSLAKLDEFTPLLGAIEAACHAQGIPVTTMISEYGAGQFEINLAHGDDVLRAADHAALLRRAVQGAAREAGCDATFMSKPFVGQT